MAADCRRRGGEEAQRGEADNCRLTVSDDYDAIELKVGWPSGLSKESPGTTVRS